jgi:hypothetical protein
MNDSKTKSFRFSTILENAVLESTVLETPHSTGEKAPWQVNLL